MSQRSDDSHSFFDSFELNCVEGFLDLFFDTKISEARTFGVNVHFVHMVVIDLFCRLSDNDLLDFLVIFGSAVRADKDDLELVDYSGFVVTLFLVEGAGDGPGESELTGVLILSLEVGVFAFEIFEDEKGPEDDVLAVKEVPALNIIAKL